MSCWDFNYDEIYGMNLDEYCELIGMTIDQLIQKNENEIKILKKKLHELVWCENEDCFSNEKSSMLVDCRHALIRKKEKHLERLKQWKKSKK